MLYIALVIAIVCLALTTVIAIIFKLQSIWSYFALNFVLTALLLMASAMVTEPAGNAAQYVAGAVLVAGLTTVVFMIARQIGLEIVARLGRSERSKGGQMPPGSEPL